MALTRESQSFDSISDLLERMRFAPSSSGVWFDSERMVLFHAATFGRLREAIIERSGIQEAKRLLMQIGYARGVEDVDVVARISSRKTEIDRLFRAGPQLMSIMGITGPAPKFEYEASDKDGSITLRASSDVSIESDLHLKRYGVADQPVCWFLNGYATGFCSAALGEPFLVRESFCRGAGHNSCKSVGQPLHSWPKDRVEFEAATYFEQGPSLDRKAVTRPDGDVGSTPHTIQIGVTGSGKGRKSESRVVGNSAGFQTTMDLIHRVARTDATALFLGETGVGKEILAHELHRLSKRAGKDLITVNCAALPEHLIEAELFGAEQGSYTGANKKRIGRFERANGGTLFLDEIGTLTLAAQAKVLRAIQNGEIERVGDQNTRRVDVRLIGATNLDLAEAVNQGSFRQDLYFRLNVFPIKIPPLRERRGDIRPLVDLFVRRFSKRHGRKISGISVAAMDLIWSYHWPGNVRELENVIERGVVIAEDEDVIDAQHIFLGDEDVENVIMTPDLTGRLARNEQLSEISTTSLSDEILTLCESEAAQQSSTVSAVLKDVEKRVVQRAVDEAGGNVSAAARALGMTRTQVAYRLDDGS